MLCEEFCLGQYTRRGVRQKKLHFADSKNHWGARSVIERKPSPAPRRSLKSLEAGLALYPHFRRHISLSGPVTAAQVQALSEATGLKERQIPRSEEHTSGLHSLMCISYAAVRLNKKKDSITQYVFRIPVLIYTKHNTK